MNLIQNQIYDFEKDARKFTIQRSQIQEFLFFYNICHTSAHPTPKSMDKKYKEKQPKIQNQNVRLKSSEEVSSIEWEFIDMTEQEEDMISRMYRLVGDRWGLIAGRIPGRKPEEIERFWLMRNSDSFEDKRIQRKIKKIS